MALIRWRSRRGATDNVRAPFPGRNLDNFFAAIVSFRASESVYATVNERLDAFKVKCAAGY